MALSTLDVDFIKNLIRDVPDFPKKGILFKDITTVLKDARAFSLVVDSIVQEFRSQSVSHVVCVEARGFVLGSAVAYALGCGIIPVRKRGKLPCRTYRVAYDLEYGQDFLEVHTDALKPGDAVLIVDDLLATGGTVQAVISLMERFGARIAGLSFFVELSFLKGREKLAPYPVHSIVQF